MIEIKHKNTGSILHRFEGDTLVGANLEGCELSYADLSQTNMSGANLKNANLSHANLANVIMGRKRIQGSVQLFLANPLFGLVGRLFAGSNTNLMGANLEGADMSAARMLEANLQNANLRRASLQGTQMGLSRLHSADLSEADLRGTVLGEFNRETKVAGARIDSRTCSTGFWSTVSRKELLNRGAVLE